MALFALGAVAANAYPLADDSQSVVVTSIHLPIALWLVVGLAYVADDWRSSRRRMDFIRFTGEWFVYFVLIALGGGVLIAFMFGTFEAIGIDPEDFISQWLLPCGAVAAVVVAGWLVEAKQSVVENIAPVLTRLFTPLFTAVLLAFLVAVGWTSAGIDVEREALILFDLLLVVVLGLLLYSISARDPLAPPGLFDKLQLALVVSALAIDVLVLLEITGRITEYGTTPNKAAALGENVILLANLAWSAWLLLRFVRRRTPFAALERWQTGYLPVYAAWAWIVVLVFSSVVQLRLTLTAVSCRRRDDRRVDDSRRRRVPADVRMGRQEVRMPVADRGWNPRRTYATRRAFPIAVVAVLCASTLAGCTGGRPAALPSPAPSPPASVTPPSVGPSAPDGTPTPTPAAAPTGEACVDATIGSLSLSGRVGQLLMIGAPIGNPTSIVPTVRRYRLGAVFLAGRSSQSAATLRDDIQTIQRAARGATGMGVEVALDQEGGLVQTLSGSDFPKIPSAVNGRAVGRTRRCAAVPPTGPAGSRPSA